LAEIGSVLGGRYRLVELLGQGGMATIYRATDAQLGRDVAVKILRPEYGRDPDFVSRFRMEAQSVASLSSPNVVAVHDFGMDPVGPFIVMDYVDGEDLATLLRRTGALQPRQSARIGVEVARALAAAHARGIIHRDIKPGNILLAQDGRVQVADFGIARALADAQMTLPGTTLGSVQYMSPEQARGEPATERSDLYSLGIVLFEMLTGRRPFEGDSAASIAMARLTPPVPLPSQHRRSIPPSLEAICRRAMAIDAAERFPSANAMADALEGVLADQAVGSPGAGAARAAGAGVAAAGAAAAGGIVGAGTPGAPRPAAVTTVGAGVARANPPANIPYGADAYAGSAGGGAGTAPVGPPTRSGGGTPSGGAGFGSGAGPWPWPWIAGILGIVILAAAGYLVFRVMSGGGATPPVNKVVVPDFVGQTLDQARPIAAAKDLVLVPIAFVKSNTQAEGTITMQDPGADSQVDKGAQINLTVVTGANPIPVPDVRNMTESQAVIAIVKATLSLGTKQEAFDPVVPVGAVISTTPIGGTPVATGATVDYVLSKGPEPSPSESPTASPSPSQPAPASATPPALLNVGEYRCQRLDQAMAAIEADGFSVGDVTPQPPGYVVGADSFVFGQSPLPGTKQAPGTAILLQAYDPGSYPYATCPPTGP
jgi:eukaryotic-like serine/threonine-protein kinase